MSVNKERPHIYVLPEDHANEQLANGFLLDVSVNSRAIEVLRPAGGWMKVLREFTDVHRGAMNRYPHRHMVLLVDFDRNDNRLQEVRQVIPNDLAERVFVLGALSEPEDLRKAKLGTLETVGRNLATDCRDNTTKTWNHELLQHNAEELDRMSPILKPILFPQA